VIAAAVGSPSNDLILDQIKDGRDEGHPQENVRRGG